MVDLFRRSFTLGDFTKIPIQNSFPYLTLSLPTKFNLWRCPRRNFQLGRNCPKFSHGGEIPRETFSKGSFRRKQVSSGGQGF